jgi:mannan endo-1,4-beta-mannosidase
MQVLGQGPYGGPPVNAPTSLSAIPTTTDVAISFTAPTQDGGLAISNYEYSFNGSSWTTLSPADATSPVTIGGLTQNTAYTVYLRAVNAGGSGPASSVLSFTTPGIPCGTTTLSSVSVTTTTATVNFSTTACGSATTGYDYYLSSWLDAATTTSPKVLSGLTPNTAYTVYMRPKNGYGVGSQSAGFAFTTSMITLDTPTFSGYTVGATPGRYKYRIYIANYDAANTYSVSVSAGSFTRSGNSITVNGSADNQYIVVYVTATRSGYANSAQGAYGNNTPAAPCAAYTYTGAQYIYDGYGCSACCYWRTYCDGNYGEVTLFYSGPCGYPGVYCAGCT